MEEISKTNEIESVPFWNKFKKEENRGEIE